MGFPEILILVDCADAGSGLCRDERRIRIFGDMGALQRPFDGAIGDALAGESGTDRLDRRPRIRAREIREP